MSDASIAELTDVIKRPRFNRYIREEERLQFLALFINTTTPVPISETITDCRDPKDNKFLEVAIAGHATHIISGDQDLLILNPYRGVRILTPRDFIDQA